MGLVFGFNASIYLMLTGTRASWGDANDAGLASGAAPSGLTLMSNVEDVKLNDDPAAANVTTRASQGFEMTAPSLSKVELTFKSIWDTSDTNLMAILSAKISRTTIPVLCIDQSSATAGAIGFWADMCVTKFDKDEALKEAQQVEITFTPGYSSVPPQWVTVASS